MVLCFGSTPEQGTKLKTIKNKNMEREQFRNMTEVELMSKIMRCDTDKADALLKYYNNDLLVLVDHLSYPNIQGVTSRMTSSLLAAIELCTRIESEKGQRQLVDRVIRDSKAIFAIFNHEMSALDHEELWALYMSTNGKVIAKKQISIGNVNSTCADLRKITLPAIEYMASNVALCHNHPHSGIVPSNPDKVLTKKAKEALALFDVRLIDHLIISDGEYYSFADNGEIY